MFLFSQSRILPHLTYLPFDCINGNHIGVIQRFGSLLFEPFRNVIAPGLQFKQQVTISKRQQITYCVAFVWIAFYGIDEKLAKPLTVPLQLLRSHVYIAACHRWVAMAKELLRGNQIVVGLDVVMRPTRLP